MNIAFCAFAYLDDYQSGHNLESSQIKNVYLMNAYVALCSCKANNPGVEVALVTNVHLSDYWIGLFEKKKIIILFKDFDSFTFNGNYDWSLAFYKLCALKYICSLDYSNIVLIDTDTFTQRSFKDIWRECESNILLYDISRGLYNDDYLTFCNEAREFLNIYDYLTRWGGEFIAGSRENISTFIGLCEKYYYRMIESGFSTINGDEFLVSIAAWNMRNKVKNGAAYVFRYWTAYRWHYVCSNYRSNPVCILHCPREKNHGFIKLFKYIKKKNKIPSMSYVYRKLRLDNLSYILIEIIKKVGNLRNEK